MNFRNWFNQLKVMQYWLNTLQLYPIKMVQFIVSNQLHCLNWKQHIDNKKCGLLDQMNQICGKFEKLSTS